MALGIAPQDSQVGGLSGVWDSQERGRPARPPLRFKSSVRGKINSGVVHSPLLHAQVGFRYGPANPSPSHPSKSPTRVAFPWRLVNVPTFKLIQYYPALKC